MTLADKRKVIEVLIACSDPAVHDVTAKIAHEKLGCGRRISALASRQRWTIDYDDYGFADHGPSMDYIEAAYRLIESSPTLRREWFGAR